MGVVTRYNAVGPTSILLVLTSAAESESATNFVSERPPTLLRLLGKAQIPREHSFLVPARSKRYEEVANVLRRNQACQSCHEDATTRKSRGDCRRGISVIYIC